MKKDEWILTSELKRLNKYGFILKARRSFEERIGIYDIVFTKTEEILEPSCSIEEVIGITNSLETCFEKIKKYNMRTRDG